MKNNQISVETGKAGRRKISVSGFCNNVQNKTLQSACCVDCFGDGRFEELELERGDNVIAVQPNNRILIKTSESVLETRDFTVL